ncbi:uncharacterized protein METZ01_LOCUS213542, partial [marine metagenome]
TSIRNTHDYRRKLSSRFQSPRSGWRSKDTQRLCREMDSTVLLSQRRHPWL